MHDHCPRHPRYTRAERIALRTVGIAAAGLLLYVAWLFLATFADRYGIVATLACAGLLLVTGNLVEYTADRLSPSTNRR